MEKNKIFSILTLGILVLTFFFGSNIFEKLKSARLEYSTDKFQVKLNEENIENEQNTIIFRQITITNIGSKPSIDINALIFLDGIVYDYEVFSVEHYENIVIQNNSFSFTMPRLTKGAKIVLKFWMKSGNNEFLISATDNKEAIKFADENEITNNRNLFRLFIMFLMIPICIYILYLYKYKPLKNEKLKLSDLNEELLNKNNILNEKNNELEINVEESGQDDTGNNILEDLSKFIIKYDKKK